MTLSKMTASINKLGLSWATPEFSAGLVCQNRTGMKIGVKMKIMIGHGMEILIMIKTGMGIV